MLASTYHPYKARHRACARDSVASYQVWCRPIWMFCVTESSKESSNNLNDTNSISAYQIYRPIKNCGWGWRANFNTDPKHLIKWSGLILQHQCWYRTRTLWHQPLLEVDCTQHSACFPDSPWPKLQRVWLFHIDQEGIGCGRSSIWFLENFSG